MELVREHVTRSVARDTLRSYRVYEVSSCTHAATTRNRNRMTPAAFCITSASILQLQGECEDDQELQPVVVVPRMSFQVEASS